MQPVASLAARCDLWKLSRARIVSMPKKSNRHSPRRNQFRISLFSFPLYYPLYAVAPNHRLKVITTVNAARVRKKPKDFWFLCNSRSRFWESEREKYLSRLLRWAQRRRRRITESNIYNWAQRLLHEDHYYCDAKGGPGWLTARLNRSKLMNGACIAASWPQDPAHAHHGAQI